MSGMERAAIAREVLTELMTWEGTQSVEAVQAAARFMSEHYPAPPAPETVTVTVDGKTYIRDKLGDWYDEAGMRWYSSEYTGPFLRRIAELESEIVNSNKHQTDEITALQRRIAELEQERDSARDERDEARRALDLANDNTRLWRERVIGLGASTTEEGHVERSSTAAPAHRTMSQGEGLGAAAPKREREAGAGSSTPVAAPKIHSHSPAPIPLGATVEVEGTRWTLGTGADDEEWCTDDGDVTHTLDHDAALAALYHARREVETWQRKAGEQEMRAILAEREANERGAALEDVRRENGAWRAIARDAAAAPEHAGHLSIPASTAIVLALRAALGRALAQEAGDVQ